MKLDRHYVPRGNVVLVGDASVGMYSLFGQGAASAMTQADCLAETLANCSFTDKNDLQSTLLEFSNSSVVEGHAISDLNLLTHVLRKRDSCGNCLLDCKCRVLARRYRNSQKHPIVKFSRKRNVPFG